MPESDEIVACSHCGSTNVRKRRVLAGPILSANRGDNMFYCEDCGQNGLLVTFESMQALETFRAERNSATLQTEKLPPKVDVIPILPLYSRSLLGSTLLESVPLRSADIVSMRWNGSSIDKTQYAVNFEDYWQAVGSSKYRAGTIYVLDISGINHGEPSFQALRQLAKCDCKILLDLGVSRPEEVMDGFMIDVEKVIASTKKLRDPEDFSDIYDLTEDCIPCIDWDEGVVWSGGIKKNGLEQIVDILAGIGFDSLILMDLKRLGTWSGPSAELAAICKSLDFNTYLGGGIKEEDVPLLLESGVNAVLTDPYTPVIRDMIAHKAVPPQPTSTIAPEPTPAKDARPAPG